MKIDWSLIFGIFVALTIFWILEYLSGKGVDLIILLFITIYVSVLVIIVRLTGEREGRQETVGKSKNIKNLEDGIYTVMRTPLYNDDYIGKVPLSVEVLLRRCYDSEFVKIERNNLLRIVFSELKEGAELNIEGGKIISIR